MLRRSVLQFILAASIATNASGAAAAPAVEMLSVQGGTGSISDSGEAVFTGGLRVTQGRIVLTAEGGTYNARTQLAVLTGKVAFVATDPRGDVRLTADRGTYNGTTRTLVAAGNIVLTRGADRLLADRLEYHFADDTYTTGPVRFGRFPMNVEGSSAQGTSTETIISDAIVTTGEPGPFTPTATVKRLVISADKTIQAENARVGVGRGIGFKVPRFNHRIGQEFLALFSVSGGYRGSLGAYLDARTHLPFGPALQLGAGIGIYTKRGVMFGPSARYISTTDPTAMAGTFNSGFINDHGDKKTDLLGRPVPENRGYVEWGHRQRIGEHLNLNAALNYWKDSEIVRDFRPDSFFPVQQPDTFASAVYGGHNYFLSLFTRFQPNNFHPVQERLPEVTFDLLPQEIGHGIYEQFHASAVHLREDPVGAGTELRSDRLDAYYAIRRPFAAGDWFAFTPVAGGRVTHYANASGAAIPGDYTRTLGEIGFDTEMRFSGRFEYRNETWGINGLRHLVTPRISYRYVPGGDKGRDHIPLIDRRAFATYLPTLGLGETRHIDDLLPLETLRLELDNVVQTRDPDYGSRDLLTFNNAVDFRYSRQPGEFDVSEIHTELSLTPAPWLRWDVYESFVPQNFTLRQINTALTIRDGDTWSLRFGNHYLLHNNDEYLLEGTRRLNEVFELQARVRYDARQDRFNEQALVVRQNLDNHWDIEYAIALYDGPRRESNFGFRLRVGSVGF